MRIIAGTKRAMRLLGPETKVSRPITDRVKESLFSVLYKYDLTDAATVADLFCGVGSLGLEALSRGANFVVFVEQDGDIIKILKKNIEKTGFVKESEILRADAFRINAALGTKRQKYDLVFVDPPYKDSNCAGPDSDLACLLDDIGDYVTDSGIVVVRTSMKASLSEKYGRLQAIEKRQWGTMAVTIFRSIKS
ncbi:MAG: 16S rRNA (guanine(966)-N(2))-methyltransferase RsmD [Sedimentisphaerales bacterium]|nr:16S rRNA (guanine(966)-N(2))-methyltransferase RsmD [Sedimentisphaerales bacterium]